MAGALKHKQRSQYSYHERKPFMQFAHKATVRESMKATEAKRTFAQRLASIFHKTTDKKGE